MSYFKYMPAERFEEHIIGNSTMYWSKMSEFNDITEGLVQRRDDIDFLSHYLAIQIFQRNTFIGVREHKSEIENLSLSNLPERNLWLYIINKLDERDSNIININNLNSLSEDIKKIINNDNLLNCQDFVNAYGSDSFCKKIRSINEENIGILCLTMNHNNLAMWAHYADNHKGVAIELKNNFWEYAISEINLYLNKPIKINYQESPPVLNEDDMYFFANNTYPDHQKVKDAIDSITKKTICTKNNIWSYEDEYRHIITLKNSNKKYSGHEQKQKLKEDAFEAFYFGEKMTEQNKNHLTDLIRIAFPKAKIYQGKLSTKSYQLDFDEII